MLQQNDFIITRNTGYRNFEESFTQWAPLMTIFNTGLSIASLLVMFRLYHN